MNVLYLIIFFILGTLMGSFYTVIGLRLPKREDFIKTKSHCDKCKHTLSLIDMIPILSYIFLKGKCRYCNKKINGMSTYMELFTGILFALAYYVFNLTPQLFIALGIVSMLIIVSVSDITYYIIPDEIVIFFSGYFIIINAISYGVIPAINSIISGLCMFIFMYLIMIIGNFIFKKESLGGGDVKIMFVIGIILHPILGVLSVFIASFLALPVSLMILKIKKQNLIPFGPFLITGMMFIFFTKIDVNMFLNFIRSI